MGRALDLNVSMLGRLELIAEEVNAGGDVEQVLQNVVEAVARYGPWTQCWVGLFDVDPSRLVRSSQFGYDDLPEHENWELEGSPPLEAMRTGNLLMIADVATAIVYPYLMREGPRAGFRAIMYIPISVGDSSVIVSFSRPEPGEFTLVERSLAKIIASFAAIAFRNVISRAGALDIERQTNAQLSAMNDVIIRQNAALERLSVVQSRLLDLQAQSAGIRVLCVAIAELIEHPIVLVDRFMQVISTAGIDAETGATLAGGIPAQLLRDLGPGSGPVEVDVDGRTLIIGQAAEGRHRLALLIAIVDKAVPGGELDQPILELAGVHVTLEILRERAALDAQVRIQEDFADALLTDDGSGIELSARAAMVGVRLNVENIVLRVRVTGGATDLDHRDAYTLAALVRRAVVSDGADAVVSPIGATDFLVIAVAESLPQAGVASLTTGIRATLRTGLEVVNGFRPSTLGISIGIGTAGIGVDGLRTSHSEASRALDVIASTTEGDRDLAIVDAGSYSLLTATDALERLVFVERYLGAIEEHDQGHGSDYLETLKTYFECVGSVQAIAERRFLHISTVRYRLAKIEQIAGVSLRSEEDRLCLQLALKLAGMASKTATDLVGRA
ncbi:helix-turn-helix domain-containing protein [Leifsonia kafniensis]|uniref:Helix-turn-helix domain-containing protein n=1 Tax=Leifsonia kafniensis TaxID=475957 RepID=A0ABP7KPY7_9MICO